MSNYKSLLLKKGRSPKKKLKKTPSLQGNPQKRGIVSKTYIRNPKKPNSAKRKVCKVRIFINRPGNRKKYSFLDRRKRIQVESYMPGENAVLQEYSVVLFRGGRVPDLPGLKYKTIRGKYDFLPVKNRKLARSKYGTKNLAKDL